MSELQIIQSQAPAEMNQAFIDLRRRIEITRQVRYAVARRFRKEKACARIIVSFLSLIIVAFSVVALVFAKAVDEQLVTIINVIIIVISFYIIIVNYEFERRDFDRQISLLEKSTAALREVYSDASEVDAGATARWDKISNRYEAILREYSYQSEDKDFNYVMLRNPQLKNKTRAGPDVWPLYIKFRYHWSPTILVVTWTILPFALLVCGALSLAFLRK